MMSIIDRARALVAGLRRDARLARALDRATVARDAGARALREAEALAIATLGRRDDQTMRAFERMAHDDEAGARAALEARETHAEALCTLRAAIDRLEQRLCVYDDRVIVASHRLLLHRARHGGPRADHRPPAPDTGRAKRRAMIDQVREVATELAPRHAALPRHARIDASIALLTRRDQARANKAAMPCPPPTHIVSRA